LIHFYKRDKMAGVSKALEPFVQQYPSWVYFSGAGTRMLKEQNWNKGIKKQIPRHYKNFYLTWQQGPSEHIHSRPSGANFEKDEWGEIHAVQNPRIHVVYPDKFHEGLWGGEGVIKGLVARPPTRHRSFNPPPAKYIWPRLLEGVVYSEILNKHIEMVMTQRGVRLVDEAQGFDNYLLNTPVNEIYAWKLLKLKREVLLALNNKDNFAGRGEGTDLYEKYQQFVVGEEEADWTGLTLQEAIKKQLIIERNKQETSEIPLKKKYRTELVEMLKSGHLDDLDVELASESGSSKNSGLLGNLTNMFK